METTTVGIGTPTGAREEEGRAKGQRGRTSQRWRGPNGELIVLRMALPVLRASTVKRTGLYADAPATPGSLRRPDELCLGH